MDVLVVFGAYRDKKSRAGHQPNASIALVDTLWDDGTGAVLLPSFLVGCLDGDRLFPCHVVSEIGRSLMVNLPAGVLAGTGALVGRASCRGGSIWATV